MSLPYIIIFVLCPFLYTIFFDILFHIIFFLLFAMFECYDCIFNFTFYMILLNKFTMNPFNKTGRYIYSKTVHFVLIMWGLKSPEVPVDYILSTAHLLTMMYYKYKKFGCRKITSIMRMLFYPKTLHIVPLNLINNCLNH